VSSRHAQFVRFERGRVLLMPRMFARGGLTLGPTSMACSTVPSRCSCPERDCFLWPPLRGSARQCHAIDDRGQASAFNRRDQRHRGDPAVYFGLDYLVEADIERRRVGDGPFLSRPKVKPTAFWNPSTPRWVRRAQTAVQPDLLAWLTAL
jgi:hypothetical protein